MANIENLMQIIEQTPDKGLYKITQAAHDFFHDNVIHKIIPEEFHNLPAEIAFEGIVGAYLLIKGLQLASEHVVDKIIPGYHEKVLPVLEKACKYGFPAALGAYILLYPDGATEVINNHPMDNWGILLAYVTGVKLVNKDLEKRKMTKEQNNN